MPTFTIAELNSDIGTNTADGIRNVANQAANFACDLYQNYADAATGLPDPTGLGAALNGLYSSLCAPRNKTPSAPPSIPFNGGQCANLPYNVSITYNVGGSGGGTLFFPSVPGPLQGVGIKQLGPQAGAIGVLAPNATGSAGILAVQNAAGPNWQGALSNVNVTNVVVTPVGHSDNCGNPSPQYRTPPPPTGVVVNNNNTVNVGANFTINAPLTIIPIRNVANIEVNPQIQVNVGPFNVRVDLGGVTVAPNINLPTDKTNPNPVYLPPTSPQPVPPKTSNCPEVNLAPVISRLENIQDDVDELIETSEDIKECSCPVPYQVQVSTAATSEGGIIDLPENTIGVYLNLTKVPVNAKIQPGRGSARDQYFCGYYWYGVGNGSTERIPINTATNWFPAPRFANSFSWSLYLGYEAVVSIETAVAEGVDAQFADVQLKRKPIE